MARWRLHWYVLAGLGLMLVGRDCSAEPVTSPPLVEAEWTPDSSPAHHWEYRDGAFHLRWLPKTAGSCLVRRNHALPTGDWAADIWLVETGEDIVGYPVVQVDRAGGAPGVRLRLEPGHDGGNVMAADLAGGPGAMPLAHGKFKAGAGRINWIRLVYNGAAEALRATINGQVVMAAGHVKVAGGQLAAGALMTMPGDNREVSLAVYAAEVREGPPPPVAAFDGPAFAGWGDPTACPPDQAKALADTAATLSSRIAQPISDPDTRAYGLAALLAAERAATGRVSADTWQKVAAQYPALSTQARSASALLLVVAAACGEKTERAAVRDWLPAHFATLNDIAAPSREDPREACLRSALLDPVRAASCPDVGPLGISQSVALADQLADKAPDVALMTLVQMIGQDWRTPGAAVWLLPRFRALSPTYAAGVERWTRAWEEPHRFALMGEPERTQAIWAWRLADTDPAAAAAVCARISALEYRAQLLEAIEPKLAAVTSEATAATVEACFQSLLAGFKPTPNDDSPVPHRLRLVRFYLDHHKDAQAHTQLAAAQAMESGSPATRFRDSWAIARLLDERKLPGLNVWLAKSVAAAAAADQGQADRGPGTIYMSASAIVAGYLARHGQIDQALALARGLADQGELDENAGLCYSAVLAALLDTDLPRALRLCQETPLLSRDPSRLVPVARKMALTDPAGALRLIEHLPDRQRVALTYTLRRLAGVPLAASDVDNLGRTLSALVTSFNMRSDRWGLRGVMKDLDTMPLATVWALEPSFAGDQALFYRQLLETVVNRRGWAGAPVWTGLVRFYTGLGGKVPWSAMMPRDIFRSSAQ